MASDEKLGEQGSLQETEIRRQGQKGPRETASRSVTRYKWKLNTTLDSFYKTHWGLALQNGSWTEWPASTERPDLPPAPAPRPDQVWKAPPYQAMRPKHA